MHVRVDGKEIIIIESFVMRDLRLAYEDGVDCLSNSTIFENLELMGFKNVSKLSNDSLLARGNTLQSDEDSMKLNELMELCTNLQSRVLALETTKTTQALEITNLKRRDKMLEKKQRSRTHKLKRLYKVGLIGRVDSSKDEPNSGKDASKHGRIQAIDANEDIILVNAQDDAEMFDVDDLHGEEVFVDKDDTDKEVNADGELNTTRIATTDSGATTIIIDEVTLAKAVAELKALKLKKRRKFFVAKKAEEKKNKPPTQQQRKIMCTYLKNMEGKKLKDLKNKSFDSIQKMFDKAFNRVNTFVDFRTELVEDYSRPSHEGYRNTIELPDGNNVVPLRSDTIRLVQNGCSFYGIRSEDTNQHLKDFLKLVNLLDLDVANRERTRLRLFYFSLRDHANNWLERLPAGSIST
nr:MAK10-like protein [Tanacetum cinerariifolium]